MKIVVMLFLILFAGYSQAQEPPPLPLLQPFSDQKDWMLVRDLRYKIFNTNKTVVVPKGFVTDLASAPQLFWSLGLSPNGSYSRAAIVHDYLYWAQVCTREQADNIMLLAMIESDVSNSQQIIMHRSVDLGGKNAWEKNKADRAKGLPRVVPDDLVSSILPNQTWEEFERELVRQNVKDPVFPKKRRYCRLGNDKYIDRQLKKLERGS